MNAPSLATFTLTIPANGADEIHRTADFLTCLSATHPFKISLDNGQISDFESGLTFNPITRINLARIVNPLATPLTVHLGFGKGNIQDNRTSIAGTLDVKSQSPDVLTTGAAVVCADAATTILAATNVQRVEAIIFNSGAGKVYIGGAAGATAGQGLPLAVGASMVLSSSAAIYARNDTGAAVSVAVAELERTT